MKNWSRRGESLSRRGNRRRDRTCPLHRHCVAAVIFVVLAAFAIPGIARAQFREHALPTATRAGDLQLGGGLTLGSSNYNFSTSNLYGAAFYTTFDVRSHWGFEGNFHQNQSSADSTVYERTYEVGPRVYLSRGSFAPYAKAMYGRGVYNFSKGVANIDYNIYTFGGGADFAVTRSLNVRGDYEYQSWPGFPLATLHPSVVTIGVAFHFHE
jgi:opacity protein-like surface antigen